MSTMQVCELDGILQEQLQIMATTLKPATIKYYRTQANGFLRYLHRNYPQIISPAQIQRHPHIVGWLRSQPTIWGWRWIWAGDMICG